MARIRSKTEEQYGHTHLFDGFNKTACGITMIDSKWWILTNEPGKGTITCKQCKKSCV